MRFFFILFLFLFVGPLCVIFLKQVDFDADWRTANRGSAQLAPSAKDTRQAVIQAYSARAYNWRGLFAVHTWIAVKPRNGKQYIVYQVIGWRLFSGLPVLMAQEDIPDRYWFNHKPHLILDLRGSKAERCIDKINAAAKSYPFSHYRLWPGPNSNTLPAYIARQVPELQLALPSNAIGKDFLPFPTFFAKAPSGTGYQFSFFGLLGIMIAKVEGLEINILGLVYGFSPSQHVIKIPGVGDVKLWP